MALGWREALDGLASAESPQRMDDGDDASDATGARAPGGFPEGAMAGRYARAKRSVTEWWEHAFLTALLARHEGQVKAAAAEAGMSGSYLWKVMKRNGM